MQQSDQRAWNPEAAADLRRKREGAMAERVGHRAAALPKRDRALLDAVYRDGRPVVELAAIMNLPAPVVRRRVRTLVRRVLSPEYGFVLANRDAWTPTRRKVADACVIEGLSIRTAAAKLRLSLHTVRAQRSIIQALADAELHDDAFGPPRADRRRR